MKTFLFCATAALAVASASPAFAQAYSGGAGTFTGLGADMVAFPGTPFDTVTFAPIAGVYTGPGSYNLDVVDFLVGINRNEAGIFSGNLGGLVGTYNGNPFAYSVDYTITIGSTDTITFGGNSFVVDGAQVFVNPLTLTSGIGTVSGLLSVRTGPAVPEPATWVTMLAGFGLVGAGLRARRKQQPVRITYA